MTEVTEDRTHAQNPGAEKFVKTIRGRAIYI